MIHMKHDMKGLGQHQYVKNILEYNYTHPNIYYTKNHKYCIFKTYLASKYLFIKKNYLYF